MSEPIQLGFTGMGRTFDVKDEHDRCFTPLTLTDAIVEWIGQHVAPRIVIEPSVGGGNFVISGRKRWPQAQFIGCDIDPDAEGLKLCDTSLVGDWAKKADEAMRIAAALTTDEREILVLGNPPFKHAITHWMAGAPAWQNAQRTALDNVPAFVEKYSGINQALIMPWAYPGVIEWREPLSICTPAMVRCILGRPWPALVRETAVYVQMPYNNKAPPRRCELVLPSLPWKKTHF